MRLIILALFGSFCLTGKAQVIKPFESFKIFKSGDKYGYQLKGQEVIPARYSYATQFSKGLALVKLDEKWGYIDSSGNWSITPRFDMAQPFNGEYAIVSKYGKIGMIDQKGDFVIKAAYSNITEDWNNYYVWDGELQGVQDKKSGHLIPAKYDQIRFQSKLTIARMPNSLYDIYYEGRKIISNVDRDIPYRDFHRLERTVIASQNGKYGVFHLTDGWIIPTKYGKIERISTPDYTDPHTSKNMDYIFVAHSADYIRPEDDPFWDGETEMTDTVRFFYSGGQAISEISFDRYEVREQTDEGNFAGFITAWKGNKRYTSNQNLDFEESRFLNIISHLSWYIGEGSDKTIIMNRYKFPIDSFDLAMPLKELYLDPETGELWDEEMIVGEPFLIVHKGKQENRKSAIYDLVLQEVVSPWFEGKLWASREINSLGQISYVYDTDKSEEGNKGFFVQGMEVGTPIQYQLFADDQTLPNNGRFYRVMHNSKTNKDDVFMIGLKEIAQVGSYDKAYTSTQVSKDSITYDEFGEPTFNRTNLFKRDFVIIQDKGKYALISQQGQRTMAIYDTIIQNTHKEFVNIKRDGKYGLFHVVSGKTIVPAYDQTLEVETTIDGSVRIDVVPINLENESYYLTSEGSKFLCGYEDVYVEKLKGGYGLACNTEKAINDQFIQAEGPYKNLKLGNSLNIYLAQDKKKKWGMIDYTGEIVLPFNYKRIEEANIEIYEMGRFYSVYQGKKKVGLANSKGQLVVFPEYEQVEQLKNEWGDPMPAFVVKKNKKYGVIDYQGHGILPAEFEKVECTYSDNLKASLITGYKSDDLIYARKFNLETPNIYLFPLKGYSFVRGESAFILNHGIIEEYDFNTGLLLRRQSTEKFEIKGEMFNIFVEKGKFGAINKDGKVLVPAIYDFAEFFDGREEVMIGFEKGVKYYIYVEDNKRYTEQEW